MCLGTILKEVNYENINCQTALQPIRPFCERLKIALSHLNDLCFPFLEFLGATPCSIFL